MLNIAQKLAFYFIWMVPFLIATKKPPLLMWCLGLFLYLLGKVLSTSASGALDPIIYTLVVVVLIFGLIVGTAAGILLDRGSSFHFAEQEFDSQKTEHMKQATSYAQDQALAETVADTELLQAALKCGSIAREFRLTRREEEVLLLLADGMNAQAIAEALVVSTSTAKSHMRNIYSKLGIHTLSELLIMIHKL